MPRIVAEVCELGCKMKRLYVRAEGGKGWDSVWTVFGQCFGKCLESGCELILKVFGKCLQSVLKVFGKCLESVGESVWKVF